MASSLIARTVRRATVKDAAIRAALAEGDGRAALNLAIRALQSEASKQRRRRPADAPLIDAELTGAIFALSAQLHDHKPQRPAGCPPVPQPQHLTAAYEASLQRAAEEAESRG